jgi:hypothetical protein
VSPTTNDEALVDAIRARAADPQRATDSADVVAPRVYPAATRKAVREAERALGFALPEFLKELYFEVGNGGFGPGYGLLGVRGGAREDGRTVVDLYRQMRQPDPADPHWRWPEHLLPIATLGCGMYVCVRCSKPDESVVWFEPNPHVEGGSWEDAFIPLAPSVAAWLEAWLAGSDTFTLESAWEAKFGKGEGAPARAP